MEIIIHSPSPNPAESLAFYKKLGYQVKENQGNPILTDGMMLIELNPDSSARPGIKIIKSSWKNEVLKLEKLCQVYKTNDGYLINDFSGCWIYLVEDKEALNFELKGESFGLTGNFSGISLEASDVEKTFAIWSAVGFTLSHGKIGDNYVVLDLNGFNVALMKPQTCPHLFINPSLTFFNGKNNLGLIKQIREANIPITEEITCFNKEQIVDNIILRDPAGYGMFIFSD